MGASTHPMWGAPAIARHHGIFDAGRMENAVESRPAAGVIDLLAWDPDLAEAFGHGDADSVPRLPVLVAHLPRGPWRAPRRAENGALGLLVLDGLIVRRVRYGRSACTELVGPGDLLRPWFKETDGVIPAQASWKVAEPAHVALLNGSVASACASSQALVAELLDRSVARTRRQGVLGAIMATKRIDERVLLVLSHLAERYGTVTGAGVLIGLPLTHALIAELIGARRPSVTTGLSELRASGAVQRSKDGWILTERGCELLDEMAQASAI